MILLVADSFGLNMFLATVVVLPGMFALGYGLQHTLLNRTLGQDILPHSR